MPMRAAAAPRVCVIWAALLSGVIGNGAGQIPGSIQSPQLKQRETEPCLPAENPSATHDESRQQFVTLYSPAKYKHDFSRASFNFDYGRFGTKTLPGDLFYGSAY